MKIDDLEQEIRKILSGYEQEIVKGVTGSARTAADECKKILRNTSPKQTGAYAKSWKVKQVAGRPGEPQKCVVYNEKHYRLTHLLEYGHAKKGGGRVAGKPHISPAEEHAINTFTEAVEEVIRGY